MSQGPTFSIIIPTYNRAGLVSQAIESVLNQRFSLFEVIVIDDHSEDSTPQVLSNFDDSRIRVVRNSQNLGKSAARNIGIEMAKGEWITFLDSDDCYFDCHLKVLAEMLHFEVNTLATKLVWEKDSPEGTGRHSELDFTRFIRENPLSLDQICYNRKVGIRFPAERIDYSEDLYFIRALALKGPILQVDTPTVWAREHIGRGMNNTDWVEFTRQNIRAALLFIESFPTRHDREILAHAYLLAANDLLSNQSSRKIARKYLNKALGFRETLLHPLMYRAVFKLMFF